MKVLVAYASAHGSTAEVAAFIGRTLDVYDVDVTVAHADTVTDVSEYDLFILGSAVHSSMWLPSLSQFMFRFEEELSQKPIYMWLNCIIVLEEDGLEKAKVTYLWEDALNRLNINKDNIEFFAGKLDWTKVSGDEKWILSNRYEGKELPGSVKGDYRNWQEIAHWAHNIGFSANFPLDFTSVREDSSKVKEETITEEEVKNLEWPDNPTEAG